MATGKLSIVIHRHKLLDFYAIRSCNLNYRAHSIGVQPFAMGPNADADTMAKNRPKKAKDKGG